MKIAFLMDPLDSLKPKKDSTLAMIQAAQSMGWSCSYFTQADLVCEQGELIANLSEIMISNLTHLEWARITPMGKCALSDFDLLLMRKDPPFDLEYIYATYALELLEKKGTLVANNPQSLRDANEKYFILNFPRCCPFTLVSCNIESLRAFWKTHESVIFKPLAAMGGRSVFYVGPKGENLSVILENLTRGERVSIMAQRYIPEIKTLGDKRILLINGDPIPYALARIPKKGESRGNLAAGATGKVVPITERDRLICNEIAPTLRAKGLYFVGIDVIGDFLTEINVTSPTCIREIEAETGIDIAGKYLQFLERLLYKRPQKL